MNVDLGFEAWMPMISMMTKEARIREYQMSLKYIIYETVMCFGCS
ncbi:uncharacterized protein METZ01_LOCUS464342 [marine metagenome]|uniref:Uncharacterized protein n=1 Tax=marine metagenome TaxID=408172 RepID=A0A383AWH4_9ZZZZ